MSPRWARAIGLGVVRIGCRDARGFDLAGVEKQTDMQGRLRIVVVGMTIGGLAVCGIDGVMCVLAGWSVWFGKKMGVVKIGKADM